MDFKRVVIYILCIDMNIVSDLRNEVNKIVL